MYVKYIMTCKNMYICDKCTKQFASQYLLKRHMSGKLECDRPKKMRINRYNNVICELSKANEKMLMIDNTILSIDNDIKNLHDNIELSEAKSINKKNKCWFCKNCYSNRQNLMRHHNEHCKQRFKLLDSIDKLTENKNEILENKKNLELKITSIETEKKKLEHKNDMKLLREEISKIIKKKTQNINIVNNNINVNNNLTVHINSFGKEDLSHIMLSDYKKYFCSYFFGFVRFIEKIHFDDNMPGNHNICITNIKSKNLHVYENDRWMLREKNDVLDKFISRKYNMLIDKCEELEESGQLSDKIIEDFAEFTRNYKDKEAQKNTKNDIMMMLYNNRDKIKTLKKH